VLLVALVWQYLGSSSRVQCFMLAASPASIFSTMSRACSNLHLGMTAEPATLARMSPVRASTTDVLQCWRYVMSGGSLVLSSGHWLMVVAGVGDATR